MQDATKMRRDGAETSTYGPTASAKWVVILTGIAVLSLLVCSKPRVYVFWIRPDELSPWHTMANHTSILPKGGTIASIRKKGRNMCVHVRVNETPHPSRKQRAKEDQLE